jgi:outer membrane lipoprotein-sorting protein
MRSLDDCALEVAQRVCSTRWRRLGLVCLSIGFLLFRDFMLPVACEADEVGSPWRQRPAPASFEELLAGFEQMDGFEARFEEQKDLALLTAPLHSSGRLYYAPPSMLLRRVEKPRRSDILVTRDHVRISDGTSEQVIDLASHPEARPLVESMLWLFMGDRASIERTYRVQYRILDSTDVSADPQGRDPVGQGWQLSLLPKDAPLDRIITELRISGVGRMTETLEVLEATGDRTRTRILDANPLRHFDPEERRQLFGTTSP